MKPRFWLVILASYLLSSCAHKPAPSLEQLDAQIATNKKSATRVYKGKTIDQVRSASQQVLMLLDPDDMTFDVRENQLLATRFSTFYAVFAVGFGRDWYVVSMKDSPGGTESSFRLAGVMNSGLLVTPTAQGFRSDIDIGAHDNPADFKLFHDRVEHLLGIRSDWPTCEEAKNESPDKRMLLCDSIGLANISPTSVGN